MEEKTLAMGWMPDLPDYRDFHYGSDTKIASPNNHQDDRSVADLLKTLEAGEKDKTRNTALRDFFPPVENQGRIGSCTANAGVGLVEYYENRAFGNFTDASRLFLYKVTRNLMGASGDTGAPIRTTMKAMRLFGIPPEQYWAYDTDQFDVEPSAFCYAYGQNFQAIKYYRLDPLGTSRQELLERVKQFIDKNFPSMFGFTVYNSIRAARGSGEIPFPHQNENVTGGHAVIAVGYDDEKEIQNPRPGSKKTVGAVQIRNSWGTGWGDEGYGWLPYEYILQGMAIDWWSLIKNEWVDSGQFS